MSITVSETIREVTVNITEDGTEIQVNPVVFINQGNDNIDGGSA